MAKKSTQLLLDVWLSPLSDVPHVIGPNWLCVGGMDSRRHGTRGDDGRPYEKLGGMCCVSIVLIVWLGTYQDWASARLCNAR